MKWIPFLDSLGGVAVFDLPTAMQLADAPRAQVTAQLSRWLRSDRLVALRRGLYAVGDRYRKVSLSPLLIANEVYRPSYLSGLWALSFGGYVPDAVPVYQSVTPRTTRRFDNVVGTFAYSSIKQTLFWGSETQSIDGIEVAIAEPEKALLDLWHLGRGEWTDERLRGMRFQQADRIDVDRLQEYARRCQSPRIERATDRWLCLVEHFA